MTAPDRPVDLGHYSAALDEIYLLRQAAAYEAHVLSSLLTYSTLPKGAREQVEAIAPRLEALARGEQRVAYAHVDNECRQRVMARAGMLPTFTRSRWEARRG